ncbi:MULTISPECIES: Crp/Fnr family transcriptional regulator [Halomonadaceae]|uniref:Helix-turn-helix domain-containing protein n=1 Tax=Vreelandella halophila TaxID=86177 RepID=A0A9X4YEQ2_9GAMM|nr:MULTISPECIES: helix-turn-helix domain-containing protein [Halomonas]MYL27843.1 helix-turn-helix domain-containing protein [Halomonas utahensis]MYL74969.1 helix-turn-helix domain-containing protein [Halomonas sp. 22501_18_FS]
MTIHTEPYSKTLKQGYSIRTGLAARMRAGNLILRRHEHLIHAGDTVRSPYLVVSGVFKSTINYENGDSQVLGFHVPGDVLGHEILLDALSGRDVVALDTSSVRRLDHLDSDTRCLLIESMCNESRRLTRQLHLERKYSTDARLAAFLIDYSDSQARRGYSRYEFILPMGRRDLSGYLGLAPETLSRGLSRLRDHDILMVSTNHLKILDPERLRNVSGMVTDEARLTC